MKHLRALVRQGIQKLGIDLHRFRPQKHPLHFLKDANIGTVIDVGANVGQFAQEARAIFPGAVIYSFEPIPSCFEQLAHAFRHDSNFHAFNIALGQRPEKRQIHVSSYAPSSSLLPTSKLHDDAFPHARENHLETITVRTLDEVLRETEIRGELLIKMDVQGFERDVILGGAAALQRAYAVISEVSFAELYRGQPLFTDIAALLGEHGFAYSGSLGQKTDPRDGRVLIQDALFLRIRA